MSVQARFRRGWGIALVVGVLLVAACEREEPQGPDAALSSPFEVVDVALSAGDEPVVVAAWGEDLLVGSRAPEGATSRPRLTVFQAAGGSREVDVTPVSPTAFQAKWLVAAPRGSTVDLVGGAPAGAHSNTRWSTWRGDSSVVRELPQPFETFGGWGAGALVSLVQTASGPVVVGSWESGGAGLDIAVWHPKGDRWMRASAAGTALASSPTALVSARGAAPDRGGLLVVGSVTLLGEGSVEQRPAVWRAPGPDDPWTRTDLPGDGSLGEAHAAACDPAGRCTVVGAVDGTVRGWTLAPGGAVTTLALPALVVGERDVLTAPLLRGEEATVVLASGGSLVVLTVAGGAGSEGGAGSRGGSGSEGDGGSLGERGGSEGDGGSLGERGGSEGEHDGIRQQTGPPARAVRSTARTGTADYVVLEDPAGKPRLVSLAVP